MIYMKDDRLTKTIKYSPIISILLGILAWVIACTKIIEGNIALAFVLILSMIGIFFGIKGLKNPTKLLSILGIIICVTCVIYVIVLFILVLWVVSAIQ